MTLAEIWMQQGIEKGIEKGLLRSLTSPHREAGELAEMGVADWSARLSAEDEGLVDEAAGKAVRWVEGQGWLEGPA